MLLNQILVQNFRGISRARLDLERTTVLLGENDSGKSRLIDALAIGMGLGASATGFNFRAHDFSRSGDGRRPKAIHIELRFQEAWLDEWATPRFEPLRPAMTRAIKGRRLMKLFVRAKMAGKQIETGWSFRDERGKAIAGADDPELLLWMRRLTPLLLLRDGFISLGSHEAMGGSGGDEARPGRSDEPADQETLRRSVEAHYRQLVTASPTISEREIAAGFDAARELVDRAARILTSRDSQPLLAADMAAVPDDAGGRPDTGQWLHGSGAQRIGLLLAVGALLEAHVADLWPDAEPLVVVEYPESHLHPLTLASVWDVIDSIKWPKLVSTHSGVLLAAVPLGAIRRIVRRDDTVESYSLGRSTLGQEDLRKVSYHVRAKRGTILFARCWLLVEGESEFWLLPRMAELCGYDLAVEGVALVEFAQCGVQALIKLARDLGIEWYLLADGDAAGSEYTADARRFVEKSATSQHITTLSESDIEHCLWHHGYDHLYRDLAGRGGQSVRPGAVIQQAIRRHSKPFLALAVAEAAAQRGAEGVPPSLREVVEGSVKLAERQ